MNGDQEIFDIARGREGLVHRTEALEGASPSGLQRRVASGRLERVRPGVLRVGGAPVTWRQGLLAACMSSGGVASHRAACQMWGLRLPERDIIDVTVQRSRYPRLGDAHLHRSSDLRTDDVTIRRGVPVTKPARTLVDLGAVCSQGVVDRAVDNAIAAKLVTVEGLAVVLWRVSRRGRRGAGVLRRCLEWRYGYGMPESPLESLALRLIERAGLPRPEVQYPITVGTRTYRADLCYPGARLVIELDGVTYHSSPDALVNDDRRQNDLVAAGYTVLRFTAVDLNQRARDFMRRIRQFLGTRMTA